MKANSICMSGFQLLLAASAILCLNACTNGTSWFPKELKLKHELYRTEKGHFVGPAGSGHSFTVYQLSKEVAADISSKGLPYLNNLPSTHALLKRMKPPKIYEYEVQNGKKIATTDGPWHGPYVFWSATPVPQETRWLRFGHDFGPDWRPSISTFYKGFKGSTHSNGFIASIPSDHADAFHKAISTPGNFYAYGGYRAKCLIVVSPGTETAYYLFRD